MTISQLRQAQGHTQETLAHAIGSSVSWVQKLENGIVLNPHYDKACALKRVLGPEVEAILEAQLKTKKDTK